MFKQLIDTIQSKRYWNFNLNQSVGDQSVFYHKLWFEAVGDNCHAWGCAMEEDSLGWDVS